jgi:hypothetical protein
MGSNPEGVGYVDFTSQIVGRRGGSLVPQTLWSHQILVFGMSNAIVNQNSGEAQLPSNSWQSPSLTHMEHNTGPQYRFVSQYILITKSYGYA